MKFLRVLLAFAILILPALAFAAPSITIEEKTVFGNKRVVFALVAFDSSYPTGGESVTAANLGMTSIEFFLAAPRSGYTFDYNYDASNLLAYVCDDSSFAMIEVGNAVSLATLDSVRVMAIGK